MSSQEVNGAGPSLFHSRERRREVVRKGGVASEKEALLLGKEMESAPEINVLGFHTKT